jgi:GNAT superfamily N-acetyltransferase
MTWTEHPVVGDDDDDVLVPPTGFGRIPPDRSTRFVERLGFRLEQAERHSQLRLPIDPQQLRQWRADAQAHAGADYRLLSWSGPTPADLVDRMAELHRRMSIDVPLAGLDLEEEVWDAERIHDVDDHAIRAGQTVLWTVAEHLPTGQLTAYTALEVPPDRVGFAYQGDTLVHGDHRGHRLGMLVKAGNLEQLTALFPAVARVHTWNAGENAHMLAINEQLGFRAASYEAIWQLRSGKQPPAGS